MVQVDAIHGSEATTQPVGSPTDSGQTATMDGYHESTYGDRYAEVYDDWYSGDGEMALTQFGTPTDVADRVAALAGNGSVLELGVGTGRLAMALADRSLDVTGLDASGAMLDRLRAKPGSERLTLLQGDMAAPPGLADDTFAVVLVGFNTFFNLTTADTQAACMSSVARLLRPGGRLVAEAFVFDPEKAQNGVSVRHVGLDRVLLDVVQVDEGEQAITGQRIEITETGNRLFPYVLRYAAPDQMDAMATAAGLRLEDRWEDWHGTAFHDGSPAHVSVWSKP